MLLLLFSFSNIWLLQSLITWSFVLCQCSPDPRVTGLIKRLGAQPHPKQKRVLCMNKVDLVKKKKDLLKVAEEFNGLPGFER